MILTSILPSILPTTLALALALFAITTHIAILTSILTPIIQGRLVEAQQSVEEERGVAVELASKLASAEEMMKNVIAINEFLVQQVSLLYSIKLLY